MIGYLFRFNDTITNNFILEEKRIDFSSPIVGVHIRYKLQILNIHKNMIFFRRSDKVGTPLG